MVFLLYSVSFNNRIIKLISESKHYFAYCVNIHKYKLMGNSIYPCKQKYINPIFNLIGIKTELHEIRRHLYCTFEVLVYF